jgi:hypothetical protein
VITVLVKLIKEYMRDTKDSNPTLIKLLPYCLISLTNRGYIYSDCFPKDQHGGDREIHVLEVKARIVQYFVERSAKCMRNMFPSDSVLNPKRKDTFMKDHEVYAQSKLGNHMTTCKSADATKWCQRHHVSKFYFLMNRITGGLMGNLYYLTFYLWVKKRIAIPDELVGILHSSNFKESDNKTLLWLKKKFVRGEAPFVGEDSNTVEIKFGMWQGIWHAVSSIMHSTVQEFYSDLSRSVLMANKISSVVTVIQGSDDSACAISHKVVHPKSLGFVHCLLKWKEEFQKFVSIWPSEGKSSIGTQLLIEYNSEWWYRGKILKPTFRWVTACLQTTIVESFYERIQIFYTELSTAVETGVCTLAGSVIQKCQAWLHYLMMGFDNHVLRERMMKLLLEFPHPALGFFPLDGEEYCGITGFDYSLYSLKKDFNLPLQNYDTEALNPSTLLDYDDRVDKSLRSEMRQVLLKFGDRKMWERIVDEIGLGDLQDALLLVKEDPARIYEERRQWDDQKMWMIMKLFQTGVRASLSAYQPTIRSAVSSSYMFNRPCMVSKLTGRDSREKVSLMKALVQAKSLTQGNTSERQWPLFPNEEEFSDFYAYVEELRKGFSFQEVPYGRHSKVKIPVWGGIHLNDTPLLDIIKRQFFQQHTVNVSRSVFSMIWDECKAKYRFLRDTYEETLKASGMDHIQLRDFFISCSSKVRSVTLQDTTAKSPDLLSAISRVYWPQIKIRSSIVSLDESILTTRHLLLCITTFFFTKEHKEKLVRKTFKNCGINRVRLMDCPHKLRKLKIISDWMDSGNKERVLKDIPVAKTGVVGFFTRRQPRSKGKNPERRYEGEGVWVGRVCDVPCRIDITDQTVRAIYVGYIQDGANLSRRLGKLISELGLKAPQMPGYSPSMYYLTPKGTLTVSPLPTEGCHPIILDSTIDFSELHQVTKKEFVVQISSSTIRLCYVEDTGSGSLKYVTLISDTMSAGDWNPTLTPTKMSWTGSTVFSEYCRGTPMRPYDLLAELDLTPEWNYMANLLSRMGNYEHAIGIYDMKALGVSLRESVISKGSTVAQKDAYLESRLAKLQKDDEKIDIDIGQIEELLEFEEPLGDVMGTIGDWADEVEEFEEALNSSQNVSPPNAAEEEVEGATEAELEDSDWKVSDETLEHVKSMLFQTDLDEIGIDYHMKNVVITMPDSNMFWSQVIYMCEQEPSGKVVLDSIKNNIKPGNNATLLSHIAFYFSLATDTNLFHRGKKAGSSHAESMSSLLRTEPIVAGLEAHDLILKLQGELSEIQEAINSVPPYVKTLLERKSNEIQLHLDSLISTAEDKQLPQYNYWTLIDTFLRLIKESGLWDKTYLTSELESLCTLLLSQCLENSAVNLRMKFISETEMNAMRVRIWDRNVSTSLLRYLASSFNLEASFIDGDSGTEIYSYCSKTVRASLTIPLH